jgi:hypothetical protein
MGNEPGQGQVDPATPDFNAKAARAKLMSRDGADTGNFEFGPASAEEERAHREEEMACFTCHLSWTTSCGGCHLPIEANWKTEEHHYEGEETRNFATYNPQVARDEMFQLGKHQTTKGNRSRRSARPRRWCCPRPTSTASASTSSSRRSARSAFPARPSRRTSRTPCADRDQDLHRLPPVGGGRQQRDHGAAAAAGHQLRQLRRDERLDRP